VGNGQPLGHLVLDLDTVTVAAGSPAAGKPIEVIEREANGAFYIVAMNRHTGERVSRPGPTVKVESGDGLVLIGRGARARECYGLFT
jgi:K+/H+ antiporter YhaU regulatory subunit KhtT